ncbi:MAG: hypothetical protein V1668_05010 [Patescibacteria group bacterium]
METKRKNDIQPLADLTNLVEYCPLCDATFTPHAISVIGDIGQSQLLHTSCTACGSSVVVLLHISELGIRSVGLITDLTDGDVRHFTAMPVISTDDVLGIHQALAAYV